MPRNDNGHGGSNATENDGLSADDGQLPSVTQSTFLKENDRLSVDLYGDRDLFARFRTTETDGLSVDEGKLPSVTGSASPAETHEQSVDEKRISSVTELSSTTETNGLSVDRRSYLKLAGATAGAVPLLTGTASAAERHGIRFQTVVDMVEDAGCDPTGDEPCDEQIRNAAGDYTLLKFPAGTYKLTEKNVILDKTNIGFVGEGDVRFKVPERFNEKALVVDRGTGVLFEGIDIDQTADGATPALHLAAEDDLRVHDVELIGQGIHPDSIPKGQPGWSPGDGAANGNPDVMDYFYPIVRSSDGSGLVTELKANNHGLMGAYNAGDGRSGIWVGTSNQGTITFKDCHIEEFGSNGTYTSRTYGVVQFEGGTYRNNDNNQIRIGSPGSSIDNAAIEVDADASDAPNPSEALNYRGVRVEMGRQHDRTDVTIRNCDIGIRSSPHTGGGVVAEATASEFLVENTTISVDVDGVCGVFGKIPDGGGAYPAPAKPRSGTLRNVTITGNAAGNAAIGLRGRPDSVIEGCRIRQSGASRNGITLVNSAGTVVNDTTINVTGVPVKRTDSPGVDEYTSGEPPAEDSSSDDSSSEDSSSENSSSEDSSSGDSSSEPGLRWNQSGALTIASPSDGRASYRLTVGANLERSDANDATIDDTDSVSENTATGQVGEGGRDSYTFDEGILAFEMDGDATLTLGGEEITADQLPDNTLTIASNGGKTSYELAVSTALGKSDALRATVDDNDDLSGTHATGQVDGGGRDSYGFTGEITSLEMDGDATVYRNGKEVDPDQLPNNTLSITSKGDEASYRFAVGGSVEQSTTNGASIDDNDTISGKTVTGQVDGGGRDSYSFSGGVLSFDIDGDAIIYRNDERMDPGEFPDNTLTIASDDESASYELTVSNELGKTNGMDATIDDNDEVSGTTASGQVGEGGRDSYGYTGEITSFRLDGDATVFVNGTETSLDDLPDNTLTISSQGGRSTYELTVDGSIEKSTVNGATADDTDSLSGNTATGQVGEGGRDSYTISGDITEFTFDGDAVIYFNDEQLSPEEVGSR
jgi:hypothetical protein